MMAPHYSERKGCYSEQKRPIKFRKILHLVAPQSTVDSEKSPDVPASFADRTFLLVLSTYTNLWQKLRGHHETI